MDFLEGLDLHVLRWFQAAHRPWLDPVVANLTDLGHRYVITAVALAGAAVFLARRQARPALLLVAAALACWVLVEGVKRTVQEPRPPRAEVRRVTPSELSEVLRQPSWAEASYSFPSGHALGSASVYLTLALLVAHRLRRRRWRVLVVAGSVVLVLVIGVTRLYLGAHYLSDVVAGWAAGAGCALLCAGADARRAAPVGPSSSIPPDPLPQGAR
jgi:undecaprenyl-diphosphatase